MLTKEQLTNQMCSLTKNKQYQQKARMVEPIRAINNN